MAYDVHLTSAAERQLSKLKGEAVEKVRQALRDLAENPPPSGCAWLKPANTWRMRVGDYRILYVIDDERREVTVHRIGPRKDVYRSL